MSKQAVILFNVFLLFLSIPVVQAQDAASIAGDWIGELDLGNQKLRLVFHVVVDEEGGFRLQLIARIRGRMGL